MGQSSDEMVRSVVARHVQARPEAISCRSHLERDLDLDPLDLVLIALRIEGILRVEFPIAQLEWVRTVADITRIVRSIAEETSSAGVFARDAQLAVVA